MQADFCVDDSDNGSDHKRMQMKKRVIPEHILSDVSMYRRNNKANSGKIGEDSDSRKEAYSGLGERDKQKGKQQIEKRFDGK